MNFYKTTFYTSLSTAITFICGFIVAKVVAVKIGPPGVAMVGQFQNTAAILTMLGAGAVNVGVVKYLSGAGAHEQRQKILSHALLIVMACSLAVSVFVLAGSGWLSRLAFHTTDYWTVYLFFGAFLFLTSVNTIFISVFNGLKEIRKLTISNIFFSVIGIVFTVLLSYLGGVKGVLIAVNFTALAVFIVNYRLFRSIGGFRFLPAWRHLDKKLLRQLFTFSMMSALGAFVLPSVQLIVRNRIISSFTITQAGYWQGVTKISDYYLTFITTVLSVYYLPRLSEITEKRELRNEIFRGYRIILPAVGVLALLIWLFRHYIILILFSKEFLPMEPLFTFQLVGDFVKIASWLLGFLMWARAMVKPFLITEVLFSITYVLWSFFFMDRFGLIGATYAFAANYVIYLITMVILMRKHIY